MKEISTPDNTQSQINTPIQVTEVINNETFVNTMPNDTIDFKKIVQNYVRHWYWFVISLAVCGFFGWFYLHKKSPQYLIKSIIMLNQKDDESANLSSISALAMQFGFGSRGGGSSTANIYDEMTRLRSDKLLSEVVATLHLNETSWFDQGFFKPKGWYWKDAPFTLRVPQTVLDTISVVTEFNVSTDKSGEIHVKVKQGKKGVIDTKTKTFPFTARTPYATFILDTTSYFHPGRTPDFHSVIIGTPQTVYNLREVLSIDEVDKKGNAIYQDITSTDVRKGEDILNTITQIYLENRFDQILYRRKEALAFIEERLINMYDELENSEKSIETYKRNNKIVEPQAEAEYIFTRKGVLEGASMQTRTELEIYTMLRDMLNSPDTQYSLLPFASSGDERGTKGLSTAINGYNELILKRMELISGVKGQSNQVDRLDEQLNALRKNILNSLSKEIQSKKIALATVEGENNSSNRRITEIPSIEKELTQLYRDREVKNAVYAFLLQKREEAEMAIQQVQPIGEIIDPAYADPKPVSPKPFLAYCIAIFIGLLLPLIFVKLLCKDKNLQDNCQN